jgi:eukaryotic-like serine/threonine-protein kinase
MSDPKSTKSRFEETELGSKVRRTLSLPDVIGHQYRVVGRLGAGAMGVVLRAEDLFLKRPVAIKLVEPEPTVLDRFLKEAQALAAVRHENVVQVYTFGPLQDSYYLAMELVVGQSLDAVIDNFTLAGETMPLPRAMNILTALGSGLEAVHARELVHRDLKPANVILEKATDRPVLIDFGLARRRSKSSPKLSITGGTPSYMAPEQSRDPSGTRVTHRTDIYAFACTAFEIFTGRPVFEGNDVYTVLLAHLNDAPRKLSSLRPELAPLDDVLLRALAKDPLNRFPSASEMVAALAAGISHMNAPSPSRARSSALVFAVDAGLRRSLTRNTEQALKAHGIELRLETAESATEAMGFATAGTFDVAIIDEESAAGRLAELVSLLRSRRPNAEVVVISRDFPATNEALAPTSIRHLVPKPVNVHVLSAVLGRLALVRTKSPSS